MNIARNSKQINMARNYHNHRQTPITERERERERERDLIHNKTNIKHMCKNTQSKKPDSVFLIKMLGELEEKHSTAYEKTGQKYIKLACSIVISIYCFLFITLKCYR